MDKLANTMIESVYENYLRATTIQICVGNTLDEIYILRGLMPS